MTTKRFCASIIRSGEGRILAAKGYTAKEVIDMAIAYGCREIRKDDGVFLMVDGCERQVGAVADFLDGGNGFKNLSKS